MKFTLLPYSFDNRFFYISPFTGNLNVSDKSLVINKISKNVKKALFFCDNPYDLNFLKYESTISINQDLFKKIDKYNKLLLKLGNMMFFASCVYSSFTKPIFENTEESYDYIAQLDIHKEKKGKICLQRALLAAKTSKTFKKQGTLFIGAHLPTGVMHAWIIENGIQPDRQDREWIMYKPLLAVNF